MGAAMLAGAVPTPKAMTRMLMPCRCGDDCKHGVLPLNVVPNEYVAPLMPVLRAYSWLKRHGMLPDGGSMLGQTHSFIEAVDFLDGEIAEIEDRRASRGRK